MDRHEFLGNGYVEILDTNYRDRYVIVKICMPCSLFQTVSPQLLIYGLIDDFSVRNPIVTWMPQLTRDRFSIGQIDDSTVNAINTCLKDELMRVSNLFIHMSQFLEDPSDLVPMLPLGVYIEFQYRCSVDKIINILEGVNGIQIIGVSEFQWSLAQVLGSILSMFEKLDKTTNQKLIP